MEKIPTVTSQTQLQKASTSSTALLRNASAVAKEILTTYPEYSKSPPEYLAAIVKVIASYPLETQNRLANLRHGIPAKCKFLPTVADIVEHVEGGTDDFASARELARRIGRA